MILNGRKRSPTNDNRFYQYTFKAIDMIHLQNIEKVYRTDTVETLALNNINLHVEKGEFLSVMGP